MTEEEIYEGCRRGDATARRELYTCFSGTMLAIGIRYLADRDEAEDLLHDVFVNVLTNFHKFSYKGEGSLRAWMKRVMVNAALDRLRHSRRGARHLPVAGGRDSSHGRIATPWLPNGAQHVCIRRLQP